MNDPARLRLREIFSRFPSNVLMDDQQIRSVIKSTYATPKIAVQILPEGETEKKTSLIEIVVFVQQFIPELYELGEKFEMIVTNNQELDEFRSQITEKTGVTNIGFVSQDRWDTTKVLSLAKANWVAPKELKKEEDPDSDSDSDDPYRHLNKYANQENKVRKLKLRDGDLVIFRDLKAELKELTKEELSKLQELENKNKRQGSRHGEEQLQIKEQGIDVDLSE